MISGFQSFALCGGSFQKSHSVNQARSSAVHDFQREGDVYKMSGTVPGEKRQFNLFKKWQSSEIVPQLAAAHFQNQL
jgi:hypothetical protein